MSKWRFQRPIKKSHGSSVRPACGAQLLHRNPRENVRTGPVRWLGRVAAEAERCTAVPGTGLFASMKADADALKDGQQV